MAQYLTLGVDREAFAIPVSQVQEILDLRPISRLPQAPPEVLGLIDVRGRCVTVVDLRRKLGLPAAEPTAASRIVILDRGAGTGMGLLADRVHDVVGIEAEALEPAPGLDGRWEAGLVAGIGRWRDAFVIVLDLVRLLDGAAPPAAARSAA